MRALTSFLPFLALVALALAAAMPYHTGTGHTKQDFSDISNQLARRAYFTDMSQFDFKPFNVTELTIRCNRANLTAHYLCNLTCKRHPNKQRKGETSTNHLPPKKKKKSTGSTPTRSSRTA